MLISNCNLICREFAHVRIVRGKYIGKYLAGSLYNGAFCPFCLTSLFSSETTMKVLILKMSNKHKTEKLTYKREVAMFISSVISIHPAAVV